jgi:hypothetical protein
MKNKNLVVLPKTSGSKKQNVNVNTYMKTSKRNNNKENIPETVVEADIIIPVSESTATEIEADIKSLSNKALNLIKAREARQINLKNKNNDREEKINNLINEIKEEELLKVHNKTEKLKNKLMKLI